MLLNQVMASLTGVDHILPSTHFHKVESVIQIIAIKISQSRAQLIKKRYLCKLTTNLLIIDKSQNVSWIPNSKRKTVILAGEIWHSVCRMNADIKYFFFLYGKLNSGILLSLDSCGKSEFSISMSLNSIVELPLAISLSYTSWNTLWYMKTDLKNNEKSLTKNPSHSFPLFCQSPGCNPVEKVIYLLVRASTCKQRKRLKKSCIFPKCYVIYGYYNSEHLV